MFKTKIVQRTPVCSAPRFTRWQCSVPFASFILSPPPHPNPVLSPHPVPVSLFVGVLSEPFESNPSIIALYPCILRNVFPKNRDLLHNPSTLSHVSTHLHWYSTFTQFMAMRVVIIDRVLVTWFQIFCEHL